MDWYGNNDDELVQATRPKLRIMVFQGSPRNIENCPGQWGKTRRIIQNAVQNIPKNVDIDYCDLSIGDGPIIQPCKGCVSTANGFHCHWPCTCYAKNDNDSPDLMHDKDIYSRLLKADGFIVFTPINWYAPSSVVKSMFDRLVCASLTITRKQAEKLYGQDDIKNPKKTRKVEKNSKYRHLLKNHLEGKVGAFFIHGDDGASDYSNGVHIPKSLAMHMKNGSHAGIDEGTVNDPQVAIRPIVWQCRYSGIHVPDDLVVGMHVNKELDYSEANDINNKPLMEAGRGLLLKLIDKLSENGH